jgi:hypothetical protein
VPDDQAPPRDVDLQLHVWKLSMDPHRIIYSTIMLMTAYAIYDEGTDPLSERNFVVLVGLSIAPLFALTMAHAFSDALDLQIRNARRLTGHDRRHLVVANIQYLYVAIPPLIVMAALGLLGWDANDVLGMVQLLGVLSLGWWGWYAGTKAGAGLARRIWFAVSYTLMGLVVIAIELLITH